MKKTSLIEAFNIERKNTKTLEVNDYDIFPDKKLLDELRVKIVVGHHGNYPTLLGITDIEIKKGEKFDPMAGVSASDGNGNDITSRIQILKNNVKYDKEGVYEVIYSVKNDNGNTLQRTRKVEVIKNESEKKS